MNEKGELSTWRIVGLLIVGTAILGGIAGLEYVSDRADPLTFNLAFYLGHFVGVFVAFLFLVIYIVRTQTRTIDAGEIIMAAVVSFFWEAAMLELILGVVTFAPRTAVNNHNGAG